MEYRQQMELLPALELNSLFSQLKLMVGSVRVSTLAPKVLPRKYSPFSPWPFPEGLQSMKRKKKRKK
jgi:hypothetical protein